jgi:hypothetical protein
VIRGTVIEEGKIPLTVISSQPGPDPAPGTYDFSPGTEVTLTAPDQVSGDGTAHRLIGFFGSGSAPASGHGNTVTFTLDEATTLEWRWQQISGPIQPVVAFDLTGTDGATRLATSFQDGIRPVELSIGPGINHASLANGYSTNGWARAEPGRDTALANGDYFEFGFTVEDGYSMSLSTVDVALRRSALNAPMFYEWQYSFDGFAGHAETIVPNGPVWDSFGWTESFFTYLGRSAVNTAFLSDEPYLYMTTRVDGLETAPMPPILLNHISELQNIPAGTSITFRLYAWGNASTSNGNTVALGRFDGPVIGGTVVPDGFTSLTVISEQPGTSPFPGIHLFPNGTELTATAPAVAPGGDGVRYILEGWTGSGSLLNLSGDGDSVTFGLDVPTTLEWNWNIQHRLHTATQGDGTVRVRTTERYPLLGFDFSNYRYNADGIYEPGATSNLAGVPASEVGPQVNPSTITRGSGLTPRDLGQGGISSENWNGTPSFEDAISGNKYLEFNVSPVGGTKIEINSIYVPYRYTQTGPHSLALVYSFDGFATYAVAESRRIQDQASGTAIDNHLFLLPDDPRLREATSEVLFRIYGWGGTGTGVGTFAILNARGTNRADMVVYGGISDETLVLGSESFWLDPLSLVELEAIPGLNTIFTGWSGGFLGNQPLLSGLTVSEPLAVQASFEADSDGDGIPDWWKLQYFDDVFVSADEDFDGDGFTNGEEYLRGSDPTVAEKRLATDDLPLSLWENVQRDSRLPGQFIIRDFGGGFRGAWENSNNNSNALTPFHPDGESVTAVNDVSFDGPRMIIREEIWDPSWSDATTSIVISVGDNDGTSLYFRYQDELNWYRVTVSGEEHAPSGPRFGISVSKRVDGQYYDLFTDDNQLASDPEDVFFYKRLRISVTPAGNEFVIEVAGWDNLNNDWDGPGDFGYSALTFTDGDLALGRAGLGSWAQGGHDHEVPSWNPVDNGVLFESFTLTLGDENVLHEDWSGAPLAGELPGGWVNAFEDNVGLQGDWRNSAHATLVQMSAQGGATSGTETAPRADADGPVILGPIVEVPSYILEIGLHPFGTGGVGFVFDYKDSDNYGRVLFARSFGRAEGSIPNGVVVSRKADGLWTDLFIGDQAFVRSQGQPFRVSFSRTADRYVMNVRETDRPEPVHRWEWDDSSGPEGGRYGFATWQSTNAHFLYADVYGVAASSTGDLKVTSIEKVDERIVLTVENESGAPYQVQRTLDLTSGIWETVDEGRTGTIWDGEIPAGAERAFWRLSR